MAGSNEDTGASRERQAGPVSHSVEAGGRPHRARKARADCHNLGIRH